MFLKNNNIKKRIAAIFLAALLIIPTAGLAAETIIVGSAGDMVSRIQTRLRDLGYFNYRTTGRFSDLSFDAARAFQANNNLPSDGQIGDDTLDALFSTSAIPAAQNPDFKTVYGPYIKAPNEFGTLIAWKEADAMLPVGTEFTLCDLYSDASFTFTRTGGVNNALITPKTQADADAFVKMCGGAPTWEKRAMLVKYGGGTYAASVFCSLSAVSDSTVLYFSGSSSDLFGLADTEHDTSVLVAAGEI